MDDSFFLVILQKGQALRFFSRFCLFFFLFSVCCGILYLHASSNSDLLVQFFSFINILSCIQQPVKHHQHHHHPYQQLILNNIIIHLYQHFVDRVDQVILIYLYSILIILNNRMIRAYILHQYVI
jgi:hypothetical protein